MQKTDKQGKNVMWCFVEFEEIVQAARCMKVLQVSPTSACITITYFNDTRQCGNSQSRSNSCMSLPDLFACCLSCEYPQPLYCRLLLSWQSA